MKRFDVRAAWDDEAKVWYGLNDELPVATEAATFPELEIRVKEIGQEMAEINGLVAPGEQADIRVYRQARAA
jgi:hypothetical protein